MSRTSLHVDHFKSMKRHDFTIIKLASPKVRQLQVSDAFTLKTKYIHTIKESSIDYKQKKNDSSVPSKVWT